MSAAGFLEKKKGELSIIDSLLIKKAKQLWPKMYKDLAWPISQLPAEMPEEIGTKEALSKFFGYQIAATVHRFSKMPLSQFTKALASYTHYFEILDIDVHVYSISRQVLLGDNINLPAPARKLIKEGANICPCCGHVFSQSSRGLIIINEQKYCQSCLNSLFYESRKQYGRKVNAYKKSLLFFLKNSWSDLEDKNWHSGVLNPEEINSLSFLRGAFGFKYGTGSRPGGAKKTLSRQKEESRACLSCSTRVATGDNSVLVIDGVSYHESCLHREIVKDPQGELTKSLRKRKNYLNRNINRRKIKETTTEENNTLFNLRKVFNYIDQNH